MQWFDKMPVIFVLMVIVFSSCRAKEDDEAPQLSILNPREHTLLEVGDTLIIDVRVHDNVAVQSVSFTLCDEHYVPVLKTYSPLLSPGVKDIHFVYPVDDKYLEGGRYELRVMASDGVNITYRYQAIQLIPAKRYRLGNAVLGKQGNEIVLELEDSLFISKETWRWTASRAWQAFALYHSMLAVVSEDKPGVKIFDLGQQKLLFEVPQSYSAGSLVNTGITADNYFFYVLRFDGHIEKYNTGGKELWTLQCQEGYYPVKAMIKGDKLLVYEENRIAGKNKLISVYHLATRALMFYYTVDFTVHDFVDYDTDRVLVFGDRKGQGVEKVYDITTNSLSSVPWSFPAVVYDAALVGHQLYTVDLSDVLRTDIQSANQWSVLVSNGLWLYSVLKYDDVDNWLYVAGPGHLQIVDLGSLLTIENKTYNHVTLDVEPVYDLGE